MVRSRPMHVTARRPGGPASHAQRMRGLPYEMEETAAMRATAVGVLTTLVLVLLAGSPAAGQGSPLSVVIVLERSAYRSGEPIVFTVRVSNVSSQPVTVNFATSQRIDVFLQSEAVEIDRLSRARSFTQVMGQQTWTPGQIVTFPDSWQPRSTLLPSSTSAATDQPVPRGVFRISAQL